MAQDGGSTWLTGADGPPGATAREAEGGAIATITRSAPTTGGGLADRPTADDRTRSIGGGDRRGMNEGTGDVRPATTGSPRVVRPGEAPGRAGRRGRTVNDGARVSPGVARIGRAAPALRGRGPTARSARIARGATGVPRGVAATRRHGGTTVVPAV